MPDERRRHTATAARDVRVREALAADAAELARLSTELGYPATADDAARRLAGLAASERHRVAVAEVSGRIAGWMHVELRLSLESGERAELVGLVVDPACRRLGVGRELVAAAARWAVEHGAATLVVRSNTAREQSHPFYAALGFALRKTQHVYEKALARSTAAGDGDPAPDERA